MAEACHVGCRGVVDEVGGRGCHEFEHGGTV